MHPHFSCNAVFFEIKNPEIKNVNILNNFFFKNDINFWGGMILRSELNSQMTGLISYAFNYEQNDKNNPLEKSEVLVRDVNETKLIRSINGDVQISNGGFEFYKDKEGKHHFAKMFHSSMEKENLEVYIQWAYSSFSAYIIKVLHLLENVNINQKNKYFFGKVFDIPDQEKK